MRSVIIGRDNPLSVRPEFALYPFPAGSSGWRLWQMLYEIRPVPRRDYVRAFQRHNLMLSPWNAQRGKQAAEELHDQMVTGSTVLLLGQDVRRAFGLEEQLIHPMRRDGITWRQIPHPSGRNPWYNDPVNRTMVGMILEEMYCDVHA